MVIMGENILLRWKEQVSEKPLYQSLTTNKLINFSIFRGFYVSRVFPFSLIFAFSVIRTIEIGQ